MIDDIRKVRKQVANAQRQKALEDSKKDVSKDKLYDKAKKKLLQIEEEKVVEHKRGLLVEQAFLALKIAGIAGLFIISAFLLNSVFTDKSPYKNVPVICNEEEPNELETKIAEKFLNEMISEFRADGTKALEKYWHVSSDEESKFYAEELLSGLELSSLDICSVKKLSDSMFSVKIMRNSYPISFRIAKEQNEMRLLSVN